MITISGRAGKSLIVDALRKSYNCIVFSLDKDYPYADFYLSDLPSTTEIETILEGRSYSYFILYTNAEKKDVERYMEWIKMIKDELWDFSYFVLTHK